MFAVELTLSRATNALKNTKDSTSEIRLEKYIYCLSNIHNKITRIWFAKSTAVFCSKHQYERELNGF